MSVFAVTYRIVSGMIGAALIASILHVAFGVGVHNGGIVLGSAALVGSIAGLLTTIRRRKPEAGR